MSVINKFIKVTLTQCSMKSALKKSRSNGAFTHILRMGWVEKGQQMYSNTQLREKKVVSVHLYIGPPSERSHVMITLT